MRRRPSDLKDAFTSLRTLGERLGLGSEFQAAVAIAAWERAAGENLSRHTAAVGLEQQRLIVAVPDKMWKRNLEELGGQLLSRLNREMGASSIRYIEFRIDNAAVSSRGQKTSATMDRYSEEKLLEALNPDLINAAEEITDDALRERFLRAAGSCLLRKDKIDEG